MTLDVLLTMNIRKQEEIFVPTEMSYSDYLDYWGILYILYIELPKMV